MLCALLLTAMPSRAGAPEGIGDGPSAAAAESLYQEGRQLLLQGTTELACARLAASQSIQAAVGTLLLLGHCYEAQGKTASAWATFRAAESLARNVRQIERAEIASVRALALELRLSRLTIQLPVGVDARSWAVQKDQLQLPQASLGTPLPLDPGEHVIVVRAPGFELWSARIVVLPESAVTLRVPALVPLPPASMPAVAPVGREAGTHSWRRTLGYVSSGLGGAGLALGLGYALHAQHRYDQSLQQCRTERACSPSGLRLRGSAERSADVATIASLSGAALVLGGLALWWTSPASETAPETVAVDTVALSSWAVVDGVGWGVSAQGVF